MVERPRRLRADVLVERPAQADVDHLRAAADAEHGLRSAMNARSSAIS